VKRKNETKLLCDHIYFILSFQILGSPEKIFDLAGPTINDREPGTPESPTDQRKTDLDLFRL